jgi:hypothetical protein
VKRKQNRGDRVKKKRCDVVLSCVGWEGCQGPLREEKNRIEEIGLRRKRCDVVLSCFGWEGCQGPLTCVGWEGCQGPLTCVGCEGSQGPLSHLTIKKIYRIKIHI